MRGDAPEVAWLDELGIADVPRVGGKNASLGEMIGSLSGKGIKVPPGFATTADAYWRFVAHNGLKERIAAALAEFEAGKVSLAHTGDAIRRAFQRGDWPPETAEAIRQAYRR